MGRWYSGSVVVGVGFLRKLLLKLVSSIISGMLECLRQFMELLQEFMECWNFCSNLWNVLGF